MIERERSFVIGRSFEADRSIASMEFYLIFRKTYNARGDSLSAFQFINIDIFYPRGVARAVIYMDKADCIFFVNYHK